MHALQFLRTLWPSQGFYVLATPFVPKGQKKAVFRHHVFSSIEDAADHVAQTRLTKDLYFGVLSLREERVWNPKKMDYKNGTMGAYEVRVHRNILSGKALFFDVDVGDAEEKYATQAEALLAVKRFVRATGLPAPMVVSSGGGIHLYWPFDRDVLVADWTVLAKQLKLLAAAHKLRVDPMRTTDISSVLRVAGTLNFKDPLNPRKVKVLAEGKVSDLGTLTQTLQHALIRAGEQVPTVADLSSRPPSDDELGDNTSRTYDDVPVQMKTLGRVCEQVKQFVRKGGDVPEPEWYGMLQLIRHTENGEHWAHQCSSGAESYDRDDTQAKLDQLATKGMGPTMCARIADVGDASICKACPHFHRKTSPLVIARNHTNIPPPVLQSAVAGATPVAPPEAPEPYECCDVQGVRIRTEDEDGNQHLERILYIPLRPVVRQRDKDNRLEHVVWQTKLPRSADHTLFTVPASDTYKTDALAAHLANNGVYVMPDQTKKVFQYMVAYIQQLQNESDVVDAHSALGWQADFQAFVLADRSLQRTGGVAQASLTPNAESAARSLHKAGTLEKQVELLRFYARPEYVAQQFFILGSLASPLFHMTGHAGVIVNATGKPGASKSTSLYTAASFWGDPIMTPLSGTQQGATTKGRMNRLTTMGSLPFCVDEVTTMPPDAVQELAMSVTQPTPRVLLNSNSTERATSSTPRSTVMLTTSNNSIQGLLAYQNSAGTAGAMRAIEIEMVAQDIHTKGEADEYLRLLRENYGHLGEAFIAHVVLNYDTVAERVRAKVREIDTLGRIRSSERFWSAEMACAIVACEIAYELGLLAFDAKALQHWIITVQLPQMRGTVLAEYDTPISTLTNYMETISAQIIVVAEDENSGMTYVKRPPVGALLGHYDQSRDTLWLLRKGFKDYCQRVGANSVEVLRALSQSSPPVVVALDRKVILGKGTDFAKGQSRCIGIKMDHREMSGAADLHVVTGKTSDATAPVRGRADRSG